MRIVVTGGAGFIGANLCRELAGRSEVESVTAFDDLSTGDARNLADIDVALVEGSILSRSLLDQVVDGAGAVIHLAARASVPRSLIDPEATHEVNVTGTVRVLEACRRRGAHVITASSSAIYGDTTQLPTHERLAANPLSPYAASKCAMEAYTLAYAAAFGLPALTFRFFNVYGPLQPVDHAYAAVVPAFVAAALDGRPMEIHGAGNQTRDFTYVGTVARVLADTATRRLTSDTPVNLAFGTRMSILELAHRISRLQLSDNPSQIVHKPPRPGDVHDSQASNDRLRHMFPDVRPVELDEGLRETAHWLADHHASIRSQLNGGNALSV